MDIKSARSGSFPRVDQLERRRALLNRLARPAGEAPLHVFCSGIGGTGLSGLAVLARELGHEVSGSDAKASGTTRALEKRGVKVAIGQKAENVAPETDLLVVTAALPPTHPEIQAAMARGTAVVKYAEALGAFVLARRGIAIAGTHGKSTTTALTAHVLREAGVDPTWVVGGKVPQLGGSAALGSGPDIVIEACEYDRSFKNYVPATAVILNVEEDHFDCYGGLEEIVEAFVQFGTGVREGGTLIVSADWPSALRVGELVKAARPDVFVSTFAIDAPAHFKAEDVTFEDGRARFELVVGGERICTVRLGIPGRHNIANALAAIAAASRAGIEPRVAAEKVPSFVGVSRRFEVLANEPFVVVDDYAHHPTAVSAVLDAARVRFPGRRIVCCFEPHQANRTRHLFKEFAEALARADRVVLADIYVCRDQAEDVSSVSSEALAAAVRRIAPGTEALHVTGEDGMVEAASAIARQGDVFLFLGAGNLATQAAHRFADAPPPCLSAAPCGGGARALDLSIEKSLGGMLTKNAPLAPKLSFRAGGSVRFLVEPKTLEEAEHAFLTLRARGVPTFVLGGGSNTLAKDGTWDGAVIATRALDGVTAHGRTLHALAGTNLQRCLHAAEQSGLAGIELFAGIPGTIGGALCGNAGGPRNAGSVGERVSRCKVVDREGRIRWIPRRELGLRYRGSDLEGTIILEVELELEPDDKEKIRARRFQAARDKATHQPLDARSAGCIFRNPAGDSAGRLIDVLGLKGRSRGGAKVSPKHANFIVNEGGARAEEILALVEDVRGAIRRERGIELELELKVLGES
jgi:UDP-N-acetylmuramate--L-alanine ligase/UDP-N-acetylenolpyruvoylglucosamine reductase